MHKNHADDALKALKQRVNAAYKSGMTAEEIHHMLIDQGYGEPMVHNGTKIELPPTDEAFVAAVEEQLNEWKVKLRAENVYMDTIPWEQERKQRDKIVRTLHRERDKEARMAAAAAPAGDPAAAPAADEAAPRARMRVYGDADRGAAAQRRRSHHQHPWRVPGWTCWGPGPLRT